MELLPPDLTWGVAGLLVAASFFTSAMTAAFGIGGGVALLTLLGYALPVAALIPVHGVVQLGSNAGRAWVQRHYALWSAALPFLFGSVVGAAAGAPFVTAVADAPLKIALGLFIVLVTWLKLPALTRGGPVQFAIGGLVTTFLTMFFGATGPLTAAFFEKSLPERRQYSGTHAVAMSLSHGFKIVAFGFAGFAYAAWVPFLAAMILSGLAGTNAGAHLLTRMPEARFRLAFRLLLTVLALDLVRRGAMTMAWF